MTLDELNDWLLNESVQADFEWVSRRSAVQDFPQLALADDLNVQTSNFDWQRLILAASFLAHGRTRRVQEAALRIATSAISLYPRTRLSDAAAVILAQLGNGRAIQLAESRERLVPNFQSRLGVSSLLGTSRQMIEDSILLETPEKWIAANRFQKEFWEKIGANAGWLSASAPTASGKTFIVLRWLGEQLAKPEVTRAVYIAPTRALVTEVEGHLREIVQSYGMDNITVSSVPVMPADLAPDRKLVFVLTQERLHLLANSGNLVVNLLLVDEAHKIGDHLRGVILQEAIERTVRSNPLARIVFVSPATENPAALLADAPPFTNTVPIDSDVPTVLQNVILATQVPNKPKEFSLALDFEGRDLFLGILRIPYRATGVRKKIAFISAALGGDGGTLVYVNGAGTAETIAQLIADFLKSQGKTASDDSEVKDLCDLARIGVHQKYLLSDLAPYGVAFHYGNMPSLLREEIESLFKKGKLQFLVCTSTLVEGVNLSCRNIVVRGPRRGKNNAMEAHDFWNLAGRAGRWGQEFQGNIICIDPKNSQAWPGGVPKRSRFPIRPETDEVLDKSSDLLNFLQQRKGLDVSSLSAITQMEQVGAYLLAIYCREGSTSVAPWSKRFSPLLLQNLDTALAELAKGVQIPSEIVDRHVGISAVAMQSLLERFRERKGDDAELVPLVPEDDQAWGRLIALFQRINKNLYPAFTPVVRVNQQALVTLNWWKGHSLARIIAERERHFTLHNIPFALPTMIRDTMELVEQIARFRAPRYLACYLDILKIYLQEVGKTSLLPDDLRLDLYLEFGVSTTTLLSLVSLGLSRMSAVELYGHMARDDMTPDECVAWVRENSERLEVLSLPKAVVSEIRRKLASAVSVSAKPPGG